MTIRAQYDADLAALKTAVAEMGGCAADAVEAALEALCTADADAAAAVIKETAASTVCSGTSSTAA